MAQTLETVIAINASVGNGFYDVGSTLTALGAQIDGLSDKLINFGKDSLKTYEDYEKSMASARVALATAYGKDTKELNQVMQDLDVAAQEWASTTIFHTNDVGNAIAEAARSGWDYSMIMAGIPAAMELAQAGSLDLSEAIHFITKSGKAAGIAFEDLGGFIDMWAYTANSSNATVESFGETMLALGSVMRFTDGQEELFALIALLHDMGTEGSTTATMLRTAMMNILAPSGTAGTVLDQLGATEEEIEQIMQDASKLEALGTLEEYGFSAFDAQGQAKPILTIFRELREVLAEIAGGYDMIDQNETTLGVLGAIFGMRGIRGALNIMAMMESAEEMQGRLLSGEADDYGEYAATTMMDTLYGHLEIWESKVEKLESRTGEVLKAQVVPVLETMGGIVDGITNLDTGTFNALVAGLEVVAAAGPGLLLAGGAFRLIGYALTPAGGIGLGLIALTAAAAAINELEKADFEGKFGEMELDPAQIQSFVETLGEDFRVAYSNVDEFTRALQDVAEQYKTTSGEFKNNLITDMLTGVEIKEGSEEYDKLFNMGDQMRQAIEDGITLNYAATKESITQTFGGDPESIDSTIWAQIIMVLEQGMELELENARSLGQRLRDAMTEAFADGHLTGEEVANIQSIIDEQNALLAQQQDREHYLERQRILRRAQTLGLGAIREASEMAETQRDAELETLRDRQAGDYYDTAAWYDRAIENGWLVPNTDGTPGEHVATQADKDAALSALAQRQESERYQWGANYSDFLMGVWTEGIVSSDLGDTWMALETLGRDLREAGGFVTQDAANRYSEAVNSRDSLQAQAYLQEMVSALGGYETLAGFRDYYTSIQDFERAQQYQLIMDMYDAMSGGNAVIAPVAGLQGTGDFTETTGTYSQIAALLDGAYGAGVKRPEDLIDYMNEQRTMGMEPDWQMYLGEGLFSQMNATAQASGRSISEMVENAVSRGGAGAIPIVPYAQGTDAIQALQGQGIEVMVDGNIQQLQAAIDGADGQTLMEYVSGDATNLSMTIRDQDGRTLTENVTGDATRLAQVISNYDGRTITVNIQGRRLFASGGRATEASIFGEAGPEWAIPEKHDDRTAKLLDAARAASGFTWAELLARNGGLNANPGGGGQTLIYMPTIYAQNADGVEEKLAEDKARLEKWYADKQMRDEAEVYA